MIYIKYFETEEEYKAYMLSDEAVYPCMGYVEGDEGVRSVRTQDEYIASLPIPDPWECAEKSFFGFGGDSWDFTVGMTWMEWLTSDDSDGSGIRILDSGKVVYDGEEDSVLEVVNLDGVVQYAFTLIVPVTNYLIQVPGEEPEESGETATMIFGFDGFTLNLVPGMTWEAWINSEYYNKETGIFADENGMIKARGGEAEVTDRIGEAQSSDMEILVMTAYIVKAIEDEEPEEPEAWTGETSTFGFANDKFVFGVGMTWGEWVNSQFYDKGTGIYIGGKGEVLCNEAQLADGDRQQFEYDEIIGGTIYRVEGEEPEEPVVPEEPEAWTGETQTFGFNDNKYEFGVGMAWQDWVDSQFYDKGTGIFIDKGGEVKSGDVQLRLGETLQFADTVIEGGYTYENSTIPEPEEPVEPEKPEAWTGETSTFGLVDEHEGKYIFGVGMTWRDWFNSEFFAPESGLFEGKGGEVMLPEGHLQTYPDVLQYMDTLIESSMVYFVDNGLTPDENSKA